MTVITELIQSESIMPSERKSEISGFSQSVVTDSLPKYVISYE